MSETHRASASSASAAVDCAAVPPSRPVHGRGPPHPLPRRTPPRSLHGQGRPVPVDAFLQITSPLQRHGSSIRARARSCRWRPRSPSRRHARPRAPPRCPCPCWGSACGRARFANASAAPESPKHESAVVMLQEYKSFRTGRQLADWLGRAHRAELVRTVYHMEASSTQIFSCIACSGYRETNLCGWMRLLLQLEAAGFCVAQALDTWILQ
jgi:hypothetical protein